MNFAARLRRRSREAGWDELTAFHTPDRDYTHGEVHDLAAKAASVLSERGVGERDRVLIALSDSIAWVVTFLAVARLGATAVPVNPGLTADDHSFQLDDCAAKLMVADESLRDRSPSFLSSQDLLTLADGATPADSVDTDAPLYVYYTSGTTGRPKGVVYGQDSLEIYHLAVGQGAFAITSADVTLSVSKMYFGYGFNNTFVFPLHTGSSAVLLEERPTPEVAQDLVSRYGVTLLYAVPSWYARLIAEADSGAFGSVRAAVSGGEALTADLAGKVGKFLDAPLLNQLGATEVGCAITANTIHHDRPGSIGKPVGSLEVEVRDSSGQVVADGSRGELWVRPVQMREYLNLPTETAEVLRAGWFRTRDLVVREPDGTYTHFGRADDMEMVGGITVAPTEIEAVLSSHPEVREAGVVAVPDELGQTKLRAFVVPYAADPPGGLAEDLIELTRGRLAAFKVPRSVHTVPNLPRTPSGKLRRYLLRQQAAELWKGASDV
ncbi:class I adenylate-forming enzyme family protein [Actinokineospora diospyrosa]|uniref:Fatty-acyl-CoA synthase n=1 Tax=Actinokineospora diospyrosa TaxID=103728 RepID=A0ABT1ILF9_9PSEU|nr:AMP-binding protein [Actinokineospora diospyrosa]MCP2273493.1 fatty-acyl-CoA synthase [Actinokineospora diospyrosa]